MLLALLPAQIVQTLHSLTIDNLRSTADECVFYVAASQKTSKSGHPIAPIQFRRFADPKLYIITILSHYLLRTKDLRRHDRQQLLLSYVKPHRPVSTDVISRWIRCVMADVGIDVDVFRGHSTRSAASSAVAASGVPIDFVLQHVGWRIDKTFARFCNKPLDAEQLAA